MGVFTFVCRKTGGEWSAKQIGEEAQLEDTSAGEIYALQRQLVQAATSVDSSGGVQSSFSLVTPDSAVFQVIVGGGGGGAFIGGGGGAGGAVAASGGGAAAAEEKEEKKEEEKEESDDDMGFSLFD